MDSINNSTYSLIVKKSCPTCELIEPVVRELADTYGASLQVYVQDDAAYLTELPQQADDTALAFSYQQNIEIVPTLIRHETEAQSEQRLVGWDRQEWQEFTQTAKVPTASSRLAGQSMTT